MVRPFLEKHLRTTIGALTLRELTTSRLQRPFADKVGELSPESLNHLRGFLFNIFEVAKKAGGPSAGRLNPVADVERFKVVPKPKRILAPEEWTPVLVEVPPAWRGPAAMVQAGAIVAERAARGAASRAEVEGILRRATEQAGRVLLP